MLYISKLLLKAIKRALFEKNNPVRELNLGRQNAHAALDLTTRSV